MNQKNETDADLEDDTSAVLIGYTIPSLRNRMGSEAIRLRFAHRLQHVMITGQTGSGKSVLARNLILADLLDKGNGLVALDYTGDFFDLILQFLAARYAPDEWEALCDRLVLIDLRQTSTFADSDEPIVGYNFLLEAGEDGYITTAAFLEILKQVWGEGVLGVQIKDDLLHVLLALTLSPHHKPSLLDIERGVYSFIAV